MKVETPLLSVIVPVYNGADFVADALASICRQPYAPLEIIVVDDGSSDAGALVITQFRQHHWPQLKYVCQPNAGPAAARNRGLGIASGEIIAFLDADDLWPDATIQGSVELLLNQGLQLVVGCTQQVRARYAGEPAEELQAFGEVWMAFSLCAAVFRREVFDIVGRFDEQLRYGEDVDWFLRAREAGIDIGIRNEVTRLYRKHDSNMTLDTEQSNHYFLAALRKSLQRRRGRDGLARDLSGVPALAGKKLADFQTPGEAKKGNKKNA